MSTEVQNAEQENRHHGYSTNTIPWYVRLIWVVFWIFVIAYGIKYFIPAIQREMLVPP